jgi:putative transposase
MGHGFLRCSLKPNITSVTRLLAFVTGLVNQELLLKNEYLLAENRILKTHLPAFRLSRPERTVLAEIGKRLDRKLLQQVASVANPDTILGWYRKLVAAKFDGSRQRRLPGRPRIAAGIENLVVRLARENSAWGYDRIVGALANLGHTVSDQTVGNILRRHGIAPAPERKRTTTWSQFIRSHMAVLAGTDFFSVEDVAWVGDLLCTPLSPSGDPTGDRRRHHRSAGGELDAADGAECDRGRRGWLSLRKIGYLLHDRDAKFSASFGETLAAGGVKCLRLPARSPNLNSYAERWVRTVKEECLSKFILFGEGSLTKAGAGRIRSALSRRTQPPRQGQRSVIPMCEVPTTKRGPSIRCHERLGGLLKYYHRKAA